MESDQNEEFYFVFIGNYYWDYLKFELQREAIQHIVQTPPPNTQIQPVFPTTFPRDPLSSPMPTPTLTWIHMLHDADCWTSLIIVYFRAFAHATSLPWNIFLYVTHLANDQLSILFLSFPYNFFKILHEQDKCKITDGSSWATSWRKKLIGNVVESEVIWHLVTFPCLWSKCRTQILMG